MMDTGVFPQTASGVLWIFTGSNGLEGVDGEADPVECSATQVAEYVLGGTQAPRHLSPLCGHLFGSELISEQRWQ